MTPDDSARNRDAQDDVPELFDLFDAHFWLERYIEFGLPKAVLPSATKVAAKKGHTLNAVTDRELTSRLQRCRHRALPLCLRWKCFGCRLGQS